MAHQCVKCKHIYPAGSRVIIDGCESCHGRFFFYIRDDYLEKLKAQKEQQEEQTTVLEMPKAQAQRIEKDIREIAGIKEIDTPIILDLESVRVTGPGKFEIDLSNLFDQKKPIVYKLEEGKYVIDLATSLTKSENTKEE